MSENPDALMSDQVQPDIVMHNIKDFRRSEQLGVKAVTPARLLQMLLIDL